MIWKVPLLFATGLSDLSDFQLTSVFEVQSAVECVIEAPGTLPEIFDVEAGDLIRLDSFEEGTTDVLLKDSVFLTGLWSQLEFRDDDRFHFEGEGSGARLEYKLRVSGRLQGLEGGDFILEVRDQEYPSSMFEARGALRSCVKLR